MALNSVIMSSSHYASSSYEDLLRIGNPPWCHPWSLQKMPHEASPSLHTLNKAPLSLAIIHKTLGEEQSLDTSLGTIGGM